MIDRTTSAVLAAESVDLVRGERYLLREITLRIEPGEHWVLLGANGAGKSTLLSLLGAVAHPTHGTVHVLGHQLGRVDMRALRAHIGHVNPRHRLDAPLTVTEVVLTGLTNTPDLLARWSPTPPQHRRAAALIGLLGMGERADARWPNLSQGERGRALIARALMPEPSVLLLDEPATGLDVAAREQLLTTLDALRTEHPSVASVLVTHHLEEIPTTTTHAALLRDGQMIGAGPVAEVLTTRRVSECFDHPVTIGRESGRWTARAGGALATGLS